MISDEAVAWFWMSEGYVNISIRVDHTHGIGYRMYPELRVCNSDVKLIDALEEWLNVNQIAHHRHDNFKSKNKTIHDIHLACIAVKQFFDKIGNYVLGEKKEIMQLIYKYFDEVYRPVGDAFKYKPTDKMRFLKGVKLHDQICEIIGPRHSRKYNVEYFLAEFNIQPNPDVFADMSENEHSRDMYNTVNPEAEVKP